MRMNRMMTVARSSYAAMFYEKMLKVYPSSVTGEVANMITVDIYKLTFPQEQFAFVIRYTLEIFLAFLMLYLYFGLAFVVGVGVVVGSLLLNYLLAVVDAIL